jgi:hypothetical protein
MGTGADNRPAGQCGPAVHKIVSRCPYLNFSESLRTPQADKMRLFQP